jgi:hypothetical protein
MRFGLKTLLMCVTMLCVVLGAYRTGYNSGRSQGRKEGYHYADAKYKYFLAAYSRLRHNEQKSYWDLIGEWFRDGGVSIIREFDETEYEWNTRRFPHGLYDDGHLESFPAKQPNSLGPES